MYRLLPMLLTTALLLAACTSAAPTSLPQVSPPPTATPPTPAPTDTPALTATPTAGTGFPVLPWAELPDASTPLVVYFSGGTDAPSLAAADPSTGVAYAYRFASGSRFATPPLSGLSPDARYFVTFSGGEIVDFYGQPQLRTDQPDLRLHVLELASGQVITSTAMLSPAYPANLQEIAERIEEDWNTVYSSGSLEERIAATQALMLERIRRVAWSPDGSLLAYPAQIPGPSSDVYFFSPASSEAWQALAEPDHVLSLDWSPAGAATDTPALAVVTAAYDRMARIDTTWVLDRDGAVLSQLTSQITRFDHWHDASHALLYGATDAGDWFEQQAIDSRDGSIRLLWEGSFGTIAFTPDLATFLIGSNIPSAAQPPASGLYLGSGEEGALRSLSDGVGWRVEYWGSPRFRFAASSPAAGTLGLTAAGELVAIDAGYYRLAAAPDGRYLAGYEKSYAGSTSAGLRIFGGDGELLRAVDGEQITCVAWNAASTLLAYQAGEQLYVWDAADSSIRLVAEELEQEECAMGWARGDR